MGKDWVPNAVYYEGASSGPLGKGENEGGVFIGTIPQELKSKIRFDRGAHPSKRDRIVWAACKDTGAQFYISRRHVPIGIWDSGELVYSFTFFRRGQKWRLFWPWMDRNVEQQHQDFDELDEMKIFLGIDTASREPVQEEANSLE